MTSQGAGGSPRQPDRQAEQCDAQGKAPWWKLACPKTTLPQHRERGELQQNSPARAFVNGARRSSLPMRQNERNEPGGDAGNQNSVSIFRHYSVLTIRISVLLGACSDEHFVLRSVCSLAVAPAGKECLEAGSN